MQKILFKILIIILFSSSYSNAELIKPRSDIKPKEVVKIQLTGLQKNDLSYKDRGIEQGLSSDWKGDYSYRESKNMGYSSSSTNSITSILNAFVDALAS